MTYRVMQKFWLDLEKPDEEEINQMIDHYKRKRQFTRIIRDGIRLMWSLGQGNLNVLFELFPWVMDEFYQQALAAHKPSDLALAEQLARLENILIGQGSVPVTNTNSGPKSLTKIAPPAPKSDDTDDDLVVMRKAKSDGSSSKNFLDSAFNLVQ